MCYSISSFRQISSQSNTNSNDNYSNLSQLHLLPEINTEQPNAMLTQNWNDIIHRSPPTKKRRL